MNIRIYTIILKVLQTIAAPLYLYYEQMISFGNLWEQKGFLYQVNQRTIAKLWYSQLIADQDQEEKALGTSPEAHRVDCYDHHAD